jgi:hypothetical protein
VGNGLPLLPWLETLPHNPDMNSLSHPGIHAGTWRFVVAAVAALMPFVAVGQTSSDLVRVEVRVQSEQDRKSIKGTTTDEVTQNKSLFITINGKAKSPETRTGTWIAYGRDLKGKASDVEVLEQGEFKIDLSAGPQKIESKKISTTYTPEHSGGEGKKGKGNKVEAEGKKYAGYVVTVKDGEKVVGQMSDPPGLQNKMK